MARVLSSIDLNGRSHIKALLGPTNTGKTHRAIQRMLHHSSGMIGLPLRLLAREVYDRIVARVGVERVALVTGEERIVPPDARYFCCTVESMPLSTLTAFVAIDEIQLATHPERGHVFTDRLLHARGVKETWFLGSDTMIPIVEQLVPTAEIVTFPRLSALRHTPPARLTTLKPRSAVVAFSAAQVYELAEQLRARRGGTAVVLGALSPRARNAQVELYQSGEVRYLVATDAIGMGLNLDIHHMALGATSKFDGRKHRPLTAAEIGQIAGRAGRFKRDGTFGLTAACAQRTDGLDVGVIDAVEAQRFLPVRRVFYRNSQLDFSSPEALQTALLQPPRRPFLIPVRSTTDMDTLTHLLKDGDIAKRVQHPDDLALLWEVCRVPDFRRVLIHQHAHLVRQLFVQLQERGSIDPDWFASRLRALDRTAGGDEVLMARIAFVRTWTYVANRENWLDDRQHWRARTRDIEDRLSDALHEALTQRFVDQRTVVLIERFASGDSLQAELGDDGTLMAAGICLGHTRGFGFVPAADATGTSRKLINRAARQVLAEPLAARVDAAIAAPHASLVLHADGWLTFEDGRMARLVAGASMWKPTTKPAQHDLLDVRQRNALHARAQAWVTEERDALLSALEPSPKLTPPARGLLYMLRDGLGNLPRSTVSAEVAALSNTDRSALHRQGIRLGFHAVYATAMLKPAMLQRRAWLWSLCHNRGALLSAPSGAPSVPVTQPRRFYPAVGYRCLGSRAVRLDMVERLDARLRGATRGGAVPLPMEPVTWLGCSAPVFMEICRALGYTIHETKEGASICRAKKKRRRSRR